MAENLESYHVQHQTHHNNNNFHNPQFYPLYDPSQLLTPDFLTTDPNPTRIRIRPEEQTQMIKTNTFYVEGAPDHHFNGDAGTTLFFKPEPLSLSLSNFHHNHQRNGISGCYEAVPGGFDGGGGGGSGVTRCTVPLGPFTGYASILKGSKFLKPAQTLLEEFCDVGSAVCAERVLDGEDLFLSFDPTAESLSAAAAADGGGESITGKKSKLISMLDEVYRKYKEYFQQLQLAVASFECIPGLGNAAPYAILASKALSKHFKCLKKAITDQLQFTSKTQQDHGDKGQCHPSFGNASDARAQRAGLSEHQPPVWRPQRGLPERAVAVLRAWLFDHFLHPYPTDTDKLMLAKQTGLSRNQVSNWFINARVRLWKPMVEEIHLLETRQSQKAGFQRDDSTRRHPNPNPNISSSISNLPENPSNSKRTRNDVLPNGFTDHSNLSYHHHQNHHHHHHIGTGVQSLGANGVSLTLGLQYQNNGVVGLSSDGNNYNSISAAAVERFGLGGGGGGGDGYVMGGDGGFEGQNRQFGRDHVLGGHFLHDFVG